MHGVHFQALACVSCCVQAVRQLHLRGPPARDEPGVLAQLARSVHSVIHCPLHVIQHVHGGAPQHNGGDAAVLPLQLAKHCDQAGGQLLHAHLVSVAHLCLAGRPHAHQLRCAHCLAQPAQLKLGGDAHSHDAVLFQKVHGNLADAAASNDHSGASVCNALDGLLHQPLLALVVLHELLWGLDHHHALGLAAGGLNAAAKHCNAGLLHVLDRAVSVALHHHALHHLGVQGVAAHNLAHAHIVHHHRGCLVSRGHGGQDGVSNQASQGVLVASLLGGNHWHQHFLRGGGGGGGGGGQCVRWGCWQCVM